MAGLSFTRDQVFVDSPASSGLSSAHRIAAVWLTLDTDSHSGHLFGSLTIRNVVTMSAVCDSPQALSSAQNHAAEDSASLLLDDKISRTGNWGRRCHWVRLWSFSAWLGRTPVSPWDTSSALLMKSWFCILGSDSIKIWNLTSIGNTIVEIRRSYNRLISTMGFPILVRWHLYIESGPWCFVQSKWPVWVAVAWCLIQTFFWIIWSGMFISVWLNVMV